MSIIERNKEKILLIISVEEEAKRFLAKSKLARQRLAIDDYAGFSGSKETGALKRAALDLKMELTKITK